MNTSVVSNTRRPAAQAIVNLPHTPPGSEDVTVVRNVPPRPEASSPVVRFKHLLAGALLISVAACGTTSGDRMVSGAGIGAGAGAVLGAVTGMGPGTGAAIGAAAGAATGGLTQKKQINLGKPIWR